MAQTVAPVDAPAPTDERLARVGMVTRLLQRPDTGAFLGAVAVWVLFAVTAGSVNWAGDFGVWSTWLNTAAYDGIVAAGLSLLLLDRRSTRLNTRQPNLSYPV